jgi:hypothetical protein
MRKIGDDFLDITSLDSSAMRVSRQTLHLQLATTISCFGRLRRHDTFGRIYWGLTHNPKLSRLRGHAIHCISESRGFTTVDRVDSLTVKWIPWIHYSESRGFTISHAHYICAAVLLLWHRAAAPAHCSSESIWRSTVNPVDSLYHIHTTDVHRCTCVACSESCGFATGFTTNES